MEGVRVTRTMRKKTFEEKGVTYAEKLIIENLDDLEKILKWNVERGIYFYRMSSGMFNWIETKEQLLKT
jgi:UV DNA damage endonuclease